MHDNQMQRIREKRKAAGLTQAQLAQMSGLDQSFISRVERGASGMSVANLCAVAAALSISPSDLLEPDSPQSRFLIAVDRIPAAQHDLAAEILEALARKIGPEPR